MIVISGLLFGLVCAFALYFLILLRVVALGQDFSSGCWHPDCGVLVLQL